MMKVYTPDNVEKIKHKHERYPVPLRPFVYKLATDPRLFDMREKIEKWFSEFVSVEDESLRNDISRRLRSKDQFRDTYNELRVGNALRLLGHKLIFNPKIDIGEGQFKTPDWLVQPSDQTPKFIVEVVTPHPPDAEVAERRSWDDICHRLEQTSLDVGVMFKFYPNCVAPSSKKQKRILSLVRRLLKEPVETARHTRVFDWDSLEKIDDPRAVFVRQDIVTIEVIRGDDHAQGWAYAMPAFPFSISFAPIKEKIEAKVRRYGKYLRMAGMSFVVVLVPHQEALYGHDTFDDAVFGQGVTKVYTWSDGSQIAVDGRFPNGVFSGGWPRATALSAAVWFSRVSSYSEGTADPIIKPITVHFNPKATNPLPESALDFSVLDDVDLR